MLIALRPEVDEAGFLEQQRDLEHVGHALGHRDDAVGDHVVAELACASAAAWKTASSPSVSSLYLTKETQRPRVAQLARQQRDPRVLAERHIIVPGIAASSSSATVRSCTAEFWRISRLAR